MTNSEPAGNRLLQFYGNVRHRVSTATNQFFLRRLGLVERLGWTLTVEDGFGTPGDTISTATVIRQIKQRHPRLRINCITRNPALLENDPNIASLNAAKSFPFLKFWYLDLLIGKDTRTNILQPTFDLLGISSYEYRAQIYLRPDEIAAAEQRLAGIARPIVTINVRSRMLVKTWRLDFWREVVARLRPHCTVIQLGDASEPELDGVTRLAGKLSIRESMAVLAQARVHLGPDSFLMHAANGLGVRSVIIFGGSRTPESLGYAENENLFAKLECSGCWIDDTHGEHCPHDVQCMMAISPETVLQAAERLLGSKPDRVAGAAASTTR